MITEARLRNALDRITRKHGAKGSGRPMSGLAIPAEYYFGRRKARPAKTRTAGPKAR